MADVMCAPFFQNIPHFITQQQQQQQQIVQKSTTHLDIQRPKEDQKKVYYCQRCLNHDRAEPRKNHKCECPFANCTCFKCSLVEKRRKLNLQLHELEGDAENLIGDDAKKILDLEEEDRKLKGERVPNCQKCGQHGRKSRLKGHKRVCPFRDCTCAKCSVVSERQKLMADQIKIRRRQRKDTLMNLTREHITSTLNAAAALSATQFNLGNFSNLNALLYGTIKTTPQSLLSSPTSSASDASSYSPSLQFPSPSLPLLLPPSPDSLTPTNNTTSTTTNTTTPLVAPVPLNPLQLIGAQDTALLQTLLAQYKLLEEVANLAPASSNGTSSPIGEVGDEEEMIIGEEEEEVSENLEHEEEEEAEEKLNCIIDVCSV